MNFLKLVLLVILVIPAGLSYAATHDSGLSMIDKNDPYDIYYGGNLDGASYVARRVKIVRIEQINGVDFLVLINESGFNSKTKEGYVLFSSVQAIVPTSTFTIIGNERSQ